MRKKRAQATLDYHVVVSRQDDARADAVARGHHLTLNIKKGDGSAALLSDMALSFDAIKSLTPMETLNETALYQMIFEATLGAKEKIDHLETKILSG